MKFDIIKVQVCFFKQEYDIQDISFKTFILPLKVKSFENNVVTLVFTGRSGSASLQYINKKYFDFLQISISVALEEDIELQIVLPGDDEEKKVSSGDIISIKQGMKHMLIAETNMSIVEVQMGKEISVDDKQKYLRE